MLERWFDRLTRRALRGPWATLTIVLVTALLGISGILTLRRELLPRTDFPRTIIVARWAAAPSSEQLVAQVTTPLEQALNAIPGVIQSESTSANGVALISLRHNPDVNQRRLSALIADATDTTALPEGSDAPIVVSFSPSDLPVLVASISAPGQSFPQLKSQISEELVPQIENLDGIWRVTMRGGQELPATGVALPPSSDLPQIIPLPLPQSWIEVAAATGRIVSTTDDVTPRSMDLIAPRFLNDLTPALWRILPPAAVKRVFLLDANEQGVLQTKLERGAITLDALLIQQLQAIRAAAEGEVLAGIALPANWRMAAQNAGLTATTTADLTAENLTTLLTRQPELLTELTPELVLALPPQTQAALPESALTALDPGMQDALRIIQIRHTRLLVGDIQEPVTRSDGSPSILLTVFQHPDADTITLTNHIFALLETYRSSHAEVIAIPTFEQASLVEQSISNLTSEGLVGAALTFAVILIFFSGFSRRITGKQRRYQLNWRTTLITAVSIPVSVLAAFALMRWLPATVSAWVHFLAGASDNPAVRVIKLLFPLEITLNVMTLSALTVSIGRMVDDSIVVLENIVRLLEAGQPLEEAILNGTREVSVAICASMGTAIAVFLPLGFVGGVTGGLFLPFALTVVYGQVASFVVAITLLPVLARMLLKQSTSLSSVPATNTVPRSYTLYLNTLDIVLRRRGLTLLLTVLVFAGSMLLLARLPRAFIPSYGTPSITVRLLLAEGTTLAATDQLTRTFEQQARQLAGISSVQTELGSDGGTATLFGGTTTQSNIGIITLSVPDAGRIPVLTPQVRALAEQTFGVGQASVSGGSQTAFGGFSLTVIGPDDQTLRTLVGPLKQALAQVDSDRDQQADMVNLKSSADLVVGASNYRLFRINGRPALSFSAELMTSNTLGVTRAAREQISAQNLLPAGVTISEGFGTQQQSGGFNATTAAIGYAMLIVYLIMAITFRSLIQPLTILVSLPLALIGVALALAVSGSSLGVSALIGILMLVGIVVNNAIVLIERVSHLRQQGLAATEALREAGRTRLRPVWMTALATIVALLPMAFSGATSEGTLIASDLAITLFGGLLVSTILTLVVMPVVYSLFDQASQKLRSLLPAKNQLPDTKR